MTLLNAKDSYGAVSRVNHWLGAALIIALLAIGLYFHEMPRGEEKLFWLRLHVSIGVLSALFLFFRIAWSVLTPAPDPVPQPALLQWGTRAIHIVLLIALVVLLVTGPLMSFSGGHDISVFNWFTLSSPLPKMEAVHEVTETLHVVASRVVLIGLILHVVGALKHLVVDRDGSWRRMMGLPVAQSS